MRFFPAALGSLALIFITPAALATTTEPNGQQVPLDSANGEVQLYTLFQNLGDPVDWQADAHSTPNAFSPLCGFTATFVLNQSAMQLGLAWYNETGATPPPSDLHVLLPAGSPVGSTFTGTAIKNDPGYLGGLVGFALVGYETHYTNPQYNNECTACSPAGHWITAVVYPSKSTPNAFYIGFEDGGTDFQSWNNDGDFNDDVFFLTGLTCSGGGLPCDTGIPGICTSGTTQCTGSGVTCQQLVQPAQEACNGLDDDCNGQVDEGDLCQAGWVCDKGTCVQSCQSGEFVCPPNLVCNASGYCVDPACKDKTCNVGEVCIAGTCKGPCDGVACPGTQVCRVGACTDPCLGVTCDAGQVCDAGVCVTRCDCLPCASGKACDSTTGLCLDPACVGVPCGAGTHCVAGGCVDDCQGAACPTGQVCSAGQCVDQPGGGGAGGGGGGTVIGFGGGGSGPGTGGSASGGAGTGADANGGAGGTGGGAGDEGSCNCGLERTSHAPVGAWAALGAIAFAVSWRRRRAR